MPSCSVPRTNAEGISFSHDFRAESSVLCRRCFCMFFGSGMFSGNWRSCCYCCFRFCSVFVGFCRKAPVSLALMSAFCSLMVHRLRWCALLTILPCSAILSYLPVVPDGHLTNFRRAEWRTISRCWFPKDPSLNSSASANSKWVDIFDFEK